nr:MAK10-like protein [Tanacetum cinerariifolium]
MPDMIHGSVMESKPKTMQDVIEFATELMDQKNSTLAECKAENKRKFKNTLRNNQNQQQPFKYHNMARADNVGPCEKKPYGGSKPLQTITQSAGGKLRDRNAKESWELLEDLALYDNESWNNPRDFTKPVKAIALPQDVLSTSDRHLLELKNQVQRLMVAPTQPTQVNKVTTSCEICSGPHDTQYYMKDPEQAFIEYASSRTDEAGVLEVLAHAPIYKAILDKYVESLELGKNRSALVQGEVPAKMEDPGLFTLPCRLGDSKPFDTLADLGSCVNVIPLYLFKKLNIRLLEETGHIFGLADGTKSFHVRIVKDVEVHIEKLKLLNDFYVIDMKNDPETPLLVGRGFLPTANAVIHCRMAKITVGEGITRSLFGVKGVDLGARTYYYARKDFLDCHLLGEWEISRDSELNPFKDTLVFLRMVEFLGSIPINLKSNIQTITQSAGGKLRDRNAKESWELLEDLALYDNESWNNPRDFTKPVKAIALPQDVLSTSDRHLLELKNQVQRLMVAPTQPTQVNKVTTSCEICSGPHDTQYYMKDPEQAFIEYASSRTDEAGVLEVLAHAPIYKAILDKYVESLELGKNRSALVQGEVPAKMEDPGLFTLPCRLGDSKPFDTLADLGSCVNVIPLYLFKKLNIRLLEETGHIFGLADGTKSFHVRIVKDVEVHIEKLKLLNDFYVIDMKNDPETPLLVGRGFLPTANAVIHCRMAKITVGEGITRSLFGVKGVDLGEEEAPYWTTFGKKESYKP